MEMSLLPKNRLHQESKDEHSNGSSGVKAEEDCADCWQGAISLAAYLAHQLQSSLIRLSETAATAPSLPSFNHAEKKTNGKLTCCKCGGVLQRAVTLHCGHSMCRKCCCINTFTSCARNNAEDGAADGHTDAVVLFECGKCMHRQQEEPKANVTVVAIVESWWKDQLKAVEWAEKGDQAQEEQQQKNLTQPSTVTTRHCNWVSTVRLARFIILIFC